MARKVKTARTTRHRADPVLPVVAGNEVASRITHDRGRKLAHERKHVPAKAMGVSRRVPGFENAAVNAPAEMLDERAEQAAVRHPDRVVALKIDIDVIHVSMPSVISWLY